MQDNKKIDNLNYPALTFPQCNLKFKRKDGQLLVWDNIRDMWLVLTREEWVRQNMIGYFVDRCSIPSSYIVQEYPVSICNMPQRADVVIFDKNKLPLMIVECKAPEITIGQSALDQVHRYNSIVGARYIYITNGLNHYLYEKYPDQEYRVLSSFPDLSLFFQ